MNEQELIERIILEIEKYGIEVIRDNYFPLDAVTHNRKKITIFNPKTVKAFKLCHELMHIKNNDRYRLGECDTTCPTERTANKGAILLLWDWFIKKGGNVNNIAQFCTITGCPYSITVMLVTSLGCDMSDKSLRECAVEYVSQFDVITHDTINIYNFLDYYGYHHNAYDEAKALLFELC